MKGTKKARNLTVAIIIEGNALNYRRNIWSQVVSSLVISASRPRVGFHKELFSLSTDH